MDLLFDKTSLSPYVRFGCLSVRYFLWKVKWCAKSNPALEHLVKEVTSKLLQREFYFTVAAQVSRVVVVCHILIGGVNLESTLALPSFTFRSPTLTATARIPSVSSCPGRRTPAFSGSGRKVGLGTPGLMLL